MSPSGTHASRRVRLIGAAAIALLCAAGCSSGSTARRTEPTELAPTTTMAATETSVSTTIPVATTTAPPLDVVDLSACPREYPKASPSTSITEDLSQRLVPIDALNIRVCQYAQSGKASRLTRLSWLALSVAKAFETETNRLVSVSSEPAAECAGTPRQGASFLLTFAVDTEAVNVFVGDCPVTASNGLLTVPVSARWYADFERYTNDETTAAAIQ